MNDDINIERHIAQTEAEFRVLNARLDAVEVRVDKNSNTNEKMDESVDSIKNKVSSLEVAAADIKTFVERINNNVFLQFTNDIDLKKLITILIVISTAISSPTLVTSWFIGNSPDDSDKKIEEIIDLLEKNAKP